MGMFTKALRRIPTATRYSNYVNIHGFDIDINTWLQENRFQNAHDKREHWVKRYDGLGDEKPYWSTTFIHPIHKAIAQKNIYAIYSLLAYEKVNIETIDWCGLPPLMAVLGSCNLHESIKKDLKERGEELSDPKLWDYQDPTTLEMIQLFMNLGSNVYAHYGYGKETALHLAVAGGHNAMPIVALLLENGAQVNAKDVHGYTALHKAAKCEHNPKEIIELLISRGANRGALTDEPWGGSQRKKRTALAIAKDSWYAKHSPEIFELLKPGHQSGQRGNE